MPERGKGGKLKAKSRSSRAGPQLPVGRAHGPHRPPKKGNYAERVGAGATAYMAAVPEHLSAETPEPAGKKIPQKLCIISRRFRLIPFDTGHTSSHRPTPSPPTLHHSQFPGNFGYIFFRFITFRLISAKTNLSRLPI